jgi:hypothetical protein
VDERDLDVAVPLAAFDERQGGQVPLGVGLVLSRGSGWLWCPNHGPSSVRSRPGRCVWRTRPGRSMAHIWHAPLATGRNSSNYGVSEVAILGRISDPSRVNLLDPPLGPSRKR